MNILLDGYQKRLFEYRVHKMTKYLEDIESGLLGEFPYVIRKHSVLGTLNGYLGVPKSHKAYGLDYDNWDVDVHGGLTYSCHHSSYTLGDFPESMDIWWFGFDCAHYDDFIPEINNQMPGTTYKDRDFVYQELEKLATYAAMETS